MTFPCCFIINVFFICFRLNVLCFEIVNFIGIGFIKEAFKSASNFLSSDLPEGPLVVKGTHKYKAIYLSLGFRPGFMQNRATQKSQIPYIHSSVKYPPAG